MLAGLLESAVLPLHLQDTLQVLVSPSGPLAYRLYKLVGLLWESCGLGDRLPAFLPSSLAGKQRKYGPHPYRGSHHHLLTPLERLLY